MNTSSTSQTNTTPAHKTVLMRDMPLRWGHYRVLIVSSMEQLIGAGLSAIVGIILPMMLLAGHENMSSFVQGVVGSAGLIGIALGSVIFGRLSDKQGYLFYFRLCPVLITIGPLLAWFFPHTGMLIFGLFLAGLGLGGGYTLDTDYISELMPEKWNLFMCGVAKATSAVGFIGYAGAAWFMLANGLQADHWRDLLLLLSALGLITFLLRIPFRESPRWLLAHGEDAKAQKAARYFFGNDVEVQPLPKEKITKQITLRELLSGETLKKVIYTGIPWACEGVGVYGVGVFLPVLIMALGLDRTHAEGIQKVINSVELTTIVNCFILPGFIVGLLLVRKMNHGKMMTWGFWGAAAGLALLLIAYLFHWPVWISVLAFFIFEMLLNAGPHLVTFILPAQVYDVNNRGLGTGVSAMLGKVGAILGVFFMPVLLKAGGMVLVLAVCIAVNILGALISAALGPKVLK